MKNIKNVSGEIRAKKNIKEVNKRILKQNKGTEQKPNVHKEVYAIKIVEVIDDMKFVYVGDQLLVSNNIDQARLFTAYQVVGWMNNNPVPIGNYYEVKPIWVKA